MAGREDSAARGESQANGASAGSPSTASSRAGENPEGEHPFSVSLAWSGGGEGCGTVRLSQADLSIAIGGAKSLGGCGTGSNPEELLLAAVGSCFVNTWAIFLNKLKITYAQPTLRATARVGSDPAGGFRVTEITIHAQVPGSLLAENRGAVEKTLALAEKYCIISRAVKGSVPVRVEIEEV